MNFSRTYLSLSRMTADASLSAWRKRTSSFVVLRPISSSSICTSRLCSFSLTKSMRWVISSFGYYWSSAIFFAFFHMFESISVELSCSTRSLLCCSSFSFRSFSLGIFVRFVWSHFSISSPPGGCWLEISCKDSVTTFSLVSWSLRSTLVFTLFTVYYRLPSSTPTICAII